MHGLDLVGAEWAGKPVLILGCGDGFEVAHARGRFGWEAVGLTLLESERRLAQHVMLGDMHALPWLDAIFDCVYSKETLEHSPAPYLALREINRVLKPGGRFCLLMPSALNKISEWYHFSVFDPVVWIDLLRKANLVTESVMYDQNAVYRGYKWRSLPSSEEIDQCRERLDAIDALIPKELRP